MDGSRTLAALLGDLRRSRGLALADAARRAGLSRSTLYQWEAGTRLPRGAPLARLLDALEAPERLRAEIVAKADPQHAGVALAGSRLGAPVGLGQVLRAMRLRKGLTQVEAARAYGVAQGTVARWEGGDDAPDAATLHAVLFALGASPEEAVALAVTQGAPAESPATPEAAIVASIAAREGQESLHEIVQLGIEADAWRRSMRDPRWDAAVTSAMARRALRYFHDGRLADAEATAAEAVRRARKPEARAEAVMALEVLERIARWRGNSPLGMVRLAEAWADAIPAGPSFEGGSKVWAAKVAARSRAAAGDLEGALESMRPFPEWLAQEFSHATAERLQRFEQVDVLLAGHAPQRALDLLQPDASTNTHRIMNVGILIANGEPVPEDWMRDLHAFLPHADPESRRAITGFERVAEGRPQALRLYY